MPKNFCARKNKYTDIQEGIHFHVILDGQWYVKENEKAEFSVKRIEDAIFFVAP